MNFSPPQGGPIKNKIAMGRKKKEFIKCCGNCLLCTHTNQGGECAITDNIVDETWEACENYIPDGSEDEDY